MMEIYQSLTEDSSLSGELKDEMDETRLINNKFGITKDDVKVMIKAKLEKKRSWFWY